MNNCKADADVQSDIRLLRVSKNTKSFDVFCTKLVTKPVILLTLSPETVILQ